MTKTEMERKHGKMTKGVRKDLAYFAKNADRTHVKLSEGRDRVTITIFLNDKCQKYIDKKVKKHNREQVERLAKVIRCFK
jgi:hypothetical protein